MCLLTSLPSEFTPITIPFSFISKTPLSGCIILFRPPRPFVDDRSTCKVCLQEMENLPQVTGCSWLNQILLQALMPGQACDHQTHSSWHMNRSRRLICSPKCSCYAAPVHRKCSVNSLTGFRQCQKQWPVCRRTRCLCHYLGETHKTDHYRFALPQNKRSTLLNRLGKNRTIADPIYSSPDHLR